MAKISVEFNVEVTESPLKQIYGVQFCDSILSFSHYFCTVGLNVASVYRIDCTSKQVELVQTFVDEDLKEDYYTVAWSSVNSYQVSTGQNEMEHVLDPLICVAGVKGIIKVINCKQFRVQSMLRGHGDCINEIKTHTIDLSFLFSASKDRSIRLWNILTADCIAIFAGDKGHKDQVLSLDIHLEGNCMVTSGMDTAINLWNLKDPKLQEVIQKSKSVERIRSAALSLDQSITLETADPVERFVTPSTAFPTIFLQYPIYSTKDIHRGFVDCVRWVGDLILSKSVYNRAALWRPDIRRYEGAFRILREYSLDDLHGIWFVKMEVFIPYQLFAVGSTSGKMHFHSFASSWDPNVSKMNRSLQMHEDMTVESIKKSKTSLRKIKVDSYTRTNSMKSDVDLTHEDESASYSMNGSSKDSDVVTMQNEDEHHIADEKFLSLKPFKAVGSFTIPRKSSSIRPATIRQCCFSPSSDSIVTVCDNGTLQVWNVSYSD